jgi:hypothetical protein
MLRVLIYTVLACGLEPQLAKKKVDSWESRITKIVELIKCSKYSIHDISRMEPLKEGDLPRFNLPFELGLDWGCRTFGPGRLSDKKCLILDRKEKRYSEVISDIAGYDIESHNSKEMVLVKVIRDWIEGITENKNQPPGEKEIWKKFNEFYTDYLIETCEKKGIDFKNMTITTYINFVKASFKHIPPGEAAKFFPY